MIMICMTAKIMRMNSNLTLVEWFIYSLFPSLKQRYINNEKVLKLYDVKIVLLHKIFYSGQLGYNLNHEDLLIYNN